MQCRQLPALAAMRERWINFFQRLADDCAIWMKAPRRNRAFRATVLRKGGGAGLMESSTGS